FFGLPERLSLRSERFFDLPERLSRGPERFFGLHKWFFSEIIQSIPTYKKLGSQFVNLVF
ncbi:hypothetical protein, partial [Lysinibacillus sp. UBA6686]|uniref:hypothetical protein n=1 Tax=Lysinibacillus sp. UBA6686 TaxID=1946776 RepID=UPI002579FB4D